MKKIIVWTAALLLLSCYVKGQTAAQKTDSIERKAAERRLRAMGGQRTENEMMDDRGLVKSKMIGKKGENKNSQEGDTTAASGMAKGSQVINANRDQGPFAEKEAKAETSNSPAVIQTTSSESGSPSRLSSDNGRGRDGTNNVQRATYNIAGSPVPGDMDLDKKNTGERNMKNASLVVKPGQQPQADTVNAKQTKKQPRASKNEKDKVKAADHSKGKDKNKPKRKNRKHKD